MAEPRKRVLALILAGLSLSGCHGGPQGARDLMTAAPQSVPAPCYALRVTFGSYAMGIDQPAAAAIQQILKSDPAVRNVERSNYGREGEYRLSIEVSGKAQAMQLAKKLRARIPAKPKGPVEVSRPFPCGSENL